MESTKVHHNHQCRRSYKHKQPISTLKSCSQTIPNVALSMRALKVDADLNLAFIMLSGPTCSYISFKEVVVCVQHSAPRALEPALHPSLSTSYCKSSWARS